jgi:hypothetical protein
MGMLDGKYWVVNGGGETLGVTTLLTRVDEVLKDAYMEDFNLPEKAREQLSTRFKFDQIRLMCSGLDVADYYATNEKEL